MLEDDNSFWFASELAALAAAGAPFGGEDLVGLAQFLTFLWIPDPRTPYAGVRSLRPGSALRWSPSGVEELRYGEELTPLEDVDGADFVRAVDGLADRFEHAARRQLLSDVPLGLMASGGIDSALLWSATKDALTRAYTIAWRDTGQERLGDEMEGVAQLHDQFRTPVELVCGDELEMDVLPPSGDLFADPAYALTRLIASRAREDGLKVLLSGQGGDELFGGYRRHIAAPLVGRIRLGRLGARGADVIQSAGLGGLRAEYATRLVRSTSGRDPFRGYMQLCTYSRPVDRARVLECTESEVDDDTMWQRHLEVFEGLPPGLSLLRKVMAVDLGVYLPGLGLAYVDRAGMEFGVEIRVPWLDIELVRWSLSLPDELLVRGRQGKLLPRALAARQISRRMASRPKRSFGAPVDRIGGRHGPPQRGFRQDRYFALAVSLLGQHRQIRLPAGG